MENKNEKNNNSELKKQRLIFICIVVGIILIITIMIGVGIEKIKNNNKMSEFDEFYGLWNIDGITKYEFDGKGRGKMLLPESNLEYEFTYKINENKVLIDFDSEEAKDYTYKYSIDNNILKVEGETPGSGKLEMTREEKNN